LRITAARKLTMNRPIADLLDDLAAEFALAEPLERARMAVAATLILAYAALVIVGLAWISTHDPASWNAR
jgi:hypothetical protein